MNEHFFHTFVFVSLFKKIFRHTVNEYYLK